MMIIKNTLEDNLRKEYDVPLDVETKDIHRYIGGMMAKESLSRFNLKE